MQAIPTIEDPYVYPKAAAGPKSWVLDMRCGSGIQWAKVTAACL
jgi:hypothetical protein